MERNTIRRQDPFRIPMSELPVARLRLSTTASEDSEPCRCMAILFVTIAIRCIPLRERILDMVPDRARLALTLAGWSNQFPPTPQFYERIWRRRAMTRLTGERFSVEAQGPCYWNNGPLRQANP